MTDTQTFIAARPASRRWLSVLLTAALAAMQTTATAQISPDSLRLPISLDADSTDYDGKSSMLMFKGLRLKQGEFGVRADEGRASKLDFADSVWQFRGNVIIDTDDGRIECETADLRFTDHQLQLATISGSPATFELHRSDRDETTYAEAGKVNYDFAAGIVEFSDNATFTEGGNQISSNYLGYNIAEQRIKAQSAGADGERVKITYTPNQAPTAVNEQAEQIPEVSAPPPDDEPAVEDNADPLDSPDGTAPQ